MSAITSPQRKNLLNQHKYRPDIDGLRAIAILSVIAFHAFPSCLSGGFVGVDIFFVISGYLISTIIFTKLNQPTSFSFKEFYARRVKRIFPALILVMTTCYVLGWCTLSAEEYAQLGKHIAGGAGFVSNFVLWNEAGYFDKVAELKPLQHLWSLGVEEQFYLIWPLLVYLAWTRKFNLFTLTLLIAITSFFLDIKKVHHDSIGAFYMPATRFWELMVGSLLAHNTLLPKQSLIPKVFNIKLLQHEATIQNIKALFGILLIIASIFGLNQTFTFPGWWTVPATIGTVLLISAGPTAWLNRNILAHPIMAWFGLISFPLYLWHWPLLSFSHIVEPGSVTRTIRIFAVIASIILAWITYKLVEKPFRFASSKKTSILCVLMVLIGFIGLSTFSKDGLKFRSSIKKIAAQQASFEWGPDMLTDKNCQKNFRSNGAPIFAC